MIAPRSPVQRTPLAEHGGRQSLVDALGVRDKVRADFSTCLNAHGPAQIVRDAIANAAFYEYPDPRSTIARAAIAHRLQRPSAEIIVSAGASELIQAVCFAYINRNDDVLIAVPAFGEYERAARLCGAAVHQVKVMAGTAAELDDFVSIIERLKPRLTFVATPSSPAGVQLTLSEVSRIAAACASCDGLLVLDQSYDAFAESALGVPALPGHTHVLHLRSLTKDHAIAGARVAFAVCNPAVADAIERARVPWSASSMCQAAAAAAMADEAQVHIVRTTEKLRDEAARIALRCRELGIATVHSSTHYLLVECDDADNARDRILETSQLLVRSCTSFGLPKYIRVAARTVVENDWLIEALTTLAAPSASAVQ